MAFTLAGIAERKDEMQAAMNDAPTGMGRGSVGADGKPTIMFTVNENK